MKVNGRNISMTRGDNEVIKVSLTDKDGAHVPLVSGDTVHFTVKTDTLTNTKLIQKIITEFIDGDAYISIEPRDTKLLDYNSYVYDVQLTKANGNVVTVVPPARFTVLEEVTYE